MNGMTDYMRAMTEDKPRVGESKITVVTRFNDERIEQHEEWDLGWKDEIQIKARELIALKEEGVRKALIELGWTPPK